MHVFVGIVGAALILLMLAEFFIAFLLPRRVKRDPRFARAAVRLLWHPWGWLGSRLPPVMGDTLLGVFGPLGLLAILALLSAGMILGFSVIYWAISSHLGSGGVASFGNDVYFSGGTFFSTSVASLPGQAGARILQVLEAAIGFSFLAIAIGYLPALFQAFSRRETSVSRLDPRAGSPPTAGALLERSSQRHGWKELDSYLREWESWMAELMETHLSYPILAYFRSQHVGQNWLAALTTVVDACAYAVVYGPYEDTEGAELTFRIGRHALADIALVFDAKATRAGPGPEQRQRLTADSLSELRATLENSGLHSEQSEEAASRLEELRASYEQSAIILSRFFRLPLPDWLPPEDVREYWRLTSGPRGTTV